ncbi:putative metal-binding protein [uncultured Desulfatiglans sp.]|uniref:Putative metal-binding protein n=1 Tax=Uncultured Desulfatiglans sp. TaxID=1748965 RepID=A0A653A816_UNCDX|nr:putative metal-binding protein [uncultured Desulfatiglans sp.]
MNRNHNGVLTNRDTLVDRAIQLGATDAKMIDTARIVFDDRAYLKCRFGCARWGRYWTCPPNLRLSPDQFMAAFDNYEKALIIQSSDPLTGQDITLAIEKEAMSTCGLPFAFGMTLCVKCEDCAFPEPCRYPHLARPAMDAFGIDVAKTVEPHGFKVRYDERGGLVPVWYSMILL